MPVVHLHALPAYRAPKPPSLAHSGPFREAPQAGKFPGDEAQLAREAQEVVLTSEARESGEAGGRSNQRR